MPAPASRLAALCVIACAAVVACSGSHAARSPAPSTTVAPSTSATISPSTPASSSVPARSTSRPVPTPPRTSYAPPRVRATPSPAGRSLPLGYSTGPATQVITVVAPSTGSTTATLQAWQKTAAGWQPQTSPIHAWVGSDGLTSQPSESRSATPIGTFTITQAFGRDANPGTALPYHQTTPADWWISQTGPLYNTLQRCAGSCPFTQGDPNEHLYDTVPFYDYAFVIDYNTRNSPTGVVQGAGSAFFVHVTVGAPTAGCVSIPEDQVVALLRWLTPAAHPRILIGIG